MNAQPMEALRMARARVKVIQHSGFQRAPQPEQRIAGPAGPEYLRALIGLCHLTQAEAARKIGVDARTMRRYLLGECEVPYLVQYAIEQLAAS